MAIHGKVGSFHSSTGPATPNLLASKQSVSSLAVIENVEVSSDGNYLYTQSQSALLFSVWDISAKATPAILGIESGISDSFPFNSVLSGNTAYMTGSNLSIISVASPATPTETGTVGHAPGPSRGIALGDNNIVYTAPPSSLLAFDTLSSPATPTKLNAIANSTYFDTPRHLVRSGNYLYGAGNSSDAIAVFDISNPATPSFLGGATTQDLNGAWAVDVSGNYAYMTAQNSNSLAVIDISSPATPAVVGTVVSTDYLTSPRGVKIKGNYAFIAGTNDDTIAVIDISDKTNPEIKTTITSAASLDAAAGIDVVGNYLYVAATDNNGFTILDISKSVGHISDAAMSTFSASNTAYRPTDADLRYMLPSPDATIYVNSTATSSDLYGIEYSGGIVRFDSAPGATVTADFHFQNMGTIGGGFEWSLDSDTDLVEAPEFGLDWMNRVAGHKDWSVTFDKYWANDNFADIYEINDDVHMKIYMNFPTSTIRMEGRGKFDNFDLSAPAEELITQGLTFMGEGTLYRRVV